MVAKLARMVIYPDRLLIIRRVSMANKLGRMITSLDGLLPIMSHDPLITWPCEIRGLLTGGGS